MSIKHKLWKADPFGGVKCQEQKCVVCCQDQKKQICSQNNVVYKNVCKTCESRGRKVEYIGETARTLFERGLEHHEDYESKTASSHMKEHKLDSHPNEEMNMKFELVMKCRSAFERQIKESVHLKCQHERGVITLNNRIEYNRCLLPSLTVVGTTKLKKKVLMIKITNVQKN